MGVAFKGHLEVARYLAGERGGARDSRAACQDCLPIPLQFYPISNALADGRMPEWPASDQGVAHGQAASNTDQTIYASPAVEYSARACRLLSCGHVLHEVCVCQYRKHRSGALAASCPNCSQGCPDTTRGRRGRRSRTHAKRRGSIAIYRAGRGWGPSEHRWMCPIVSRNGHREWILDHGLSNDLRRWLGQMERLQVIARLIPAEFSPSRLGASPHSVGA